MRLPAGDAYYSAIQNPRTAFRDPELKTCLVEVQPGLFGATLPKPYSGGFTVTYHLYNRAGVSWAVRCFIKDVPELQRRYDALGRFLAETRSSYFVPAACQYEGIQVNAAWHPIIKMQWVEGQQLNAFVETQIANTTGLAKVTDEFERLVQALEQWGIAHGDLQHGNILVSNGRLRLIDYDGMFLPDLATLGSGEIGHVNYQHPGRDKSDYGPALDRFSSIVIDLGLRALTLAPNLWAKYNNGENLLFAQNDFLRPQISPLLNELAKLPQLASHVQAFRTICAAPPSNTPTLELFLKGALSLPVVVVAPQPLYQARSQFTVIDGSKRKTLSQHIGQRVEVVGLIEDWHRGIGVNGRPYLFLNFGHHPYQTFVIVLWSQAIDRFGMKGVDPISLIGKWVSVTGVIGSYNGKAQMTIDGSADLQVLSRNEAMKRLGRPVPSAPRPIPSQKVAGSGAVNQYATTVQQPTPLPATSLSVQSSQSSSRSGSTTAHDAKILNQLYGGASEHGAPATISASPPQPKNSQQQTEPAIIRVFREIANMLLRKGP
jgi:hypothetical protein